MDDRTLLNSLPRQTRILVVWDGHADRPAPLVAAHAAQGWCLGRCAVVHEGRLPRDVRRLVEYLERCRAEVLLLMTTLHRDRLAELAQAGLCCGVRVCADVRMRTEFSSVSGATLMLCERDQVAKAARLHAAGVVSFDGELLSLVTRSEHRILPTVWRGVWGEGVELAALHAAALAWPLGDAAAWQACALAARAALDRRGPAPVTWSDLARISQGPEPLSVRSAA